MVKEIKMKKYDLTIQLDNLLRTAKTVSLVNEIKNNNPYSIYGRVNNFALVYKDGFIDKCYDTIVNMKARNVKVKMKTMKFNKKELKDEILLQYSRNDCGIKVNKVDSFIQLLLDIDNGLPHSYNTLLICACVLSEIVGSNASDLFGYFYNKLPKDKIGSLRAISGNDLLELNPSVIIMDGNKIINLDDELSILKSEVTNYEEWLKGEDREISNIIFKEYNDLVENTITIPKDIIVGGNALLNDFIENDHREDSYKILSFVRDIIQCLDGSKVIKDIMDNSIEGLLDYLSNNINDEVIEFININNSFEYIDLEEDSGFMTEEDLELVDEYFMIKTIVKNLTYRKFDDNYITNFDSLVTNEDGDSLGETFINAMGDFINRYNSIDKDTVSFIVELTNPTLLEHVDDIKLTMNSPFNYKLPITIKELGIKGGAIRERLFKNRYGL